MPTPQYAVRMIAREEAIAMGLAQRTTVPTSTEAGAEKVLERTAALVPWLGEEAARVEEARRIPDDVAERLFETGLFNLMRPTRFGGFGVSPRFSWEAAFHIALGCSSSAWLARPTSGNISMLCKC